MFSFNLWNMQGFAGFEAIWFFVNNNFRNGYIPWCYTFYGGSVGLTLDFNKLLSPNMITNPKTVLSGFGLNISCAVSVSCFLVTGKNFRDPYDYIDWVDSWSTTVWGATVSKSSSARSTTYGLGVSFEVSVKRWRTSIGKKLFGTMGGRSYYKMVCVGKNSKNLYNAVKGRV